MKYPILFLSFLIITSACFAQFEGKVQWGGEVFKPASATSFSVIGNWQEGILMQSQTRAKVFSSSKTYLQRFDDLTLLPQYSKEIELETKRGDKSLEYQVMQKLGKRPVLFASYFNRDKDKIELYGRIYDIEGAAIGKEEKIAQFPASRKNDVQSLQFVASSDSASMLTFYSEPVDKQSNENISFHYFDSNLQSKWERQIEFPYKGKNFRIHKAQVNQNGQVFLLVKIYYDREGKSNRNSPPFRYSLVTFSGDSSSVEDYELSLGNKFITDINMFVEDERKIICSGFYSNLGTSSAAGTFFLKVNRDNQTIEGKELSDFDPSFASSFIESSRIRGKVELSDFKLDHFVRFIDGSFGLVAEQFLIDEVCFQDFRTGMFTCNYFYYFNNIIVIKMDNSGEVIWAADIPKYQESSNDAGYFSSYAFGFNGEAMHFVFNDNPKNLTETDERRAHRMDNVKRAVIVHAMLGMDGSFSRVNASSEKRNRFFFIPEFSAQISDESMWLVGVSSNKYRAGVLKID